MSSSLIMIIKILFLICTTSLESITSAKTCPKTKSCSPNGSLAVRFPFRLINDQDHRDHDRDRDLPRCVYPGFDLSCNDTLSKTTTIALPTGVFSVQNILYKSQTLTVNDPFQCLPKRFIERNFSLDGTPFRVLRFGTFTFLNCSSTSSPVGFEPIRCLSGRTFTVVAIPTVLFEPPPLFCEVFATVSVPVLSSNRWWVDYEWESFLRNEVVLEWDEPGCGDCELRGGECGFAGESGSEIGCFNLPNNRGLSKGTQFALFAITGIVMFSFFCFNCPLKRRLMIRLRNAVRVYTTRRANQSNDEINIIANNNTQPNQPSTTQINNNNNINISTHNINVVPSSPGLDKAVIETYPKSLVGESPKLLSSNYNVCPICLSEYRSRDTLRTLPDCFHYFHSDCIDEWLKMNATCPLCRNSPLIMSPYS